MYRERIVLIFVLLSLVGLANYSVAIHSAANITFTDDGSIFLGPALLPYSRNDIGKALETLKFRSGVEIGVLLGEFARHLLSTWPSCQRMVLVDPWLHQKNYHDSANYNQQQQDMNYIETLRALAPWKNITEIFRLKSSDAAPLVENNSLDFVYLDARHDYCAVSEDLRLWWPKVRSGGIFAGHDFLTNGELIPCLESNDWGLCEDGSRNEGAVKGAVVDFAKANNLSVLQTMGERCFRSFLIVKP